MEMLFAWFDSQRASLHTPVMSEPWANIVEKFREWGSLENGAFGVATSGIAQIASLIAAGPLKVALFGWTSMHDLCIQQSDVRPYSGPYLRISPLPSGSVEFRYIDTAIADRQWQRVEAANRAVERLLTFLEQLRWIAPTPNAANDSPV
ncbi:hypothetical protein ACHMW4_28365 [Mesorhizobium sp. UC22_110]|uniref:hypothetical protein n=1 Tax=unclassified Mesorhizobium TaxID=325217 RepID=UPI00367256EE